MAELPLGLDSKNLTVLGDGTVVRKFGKHLYISDDASVPIGNRVIVSTTTIFRCIFKRVEASFKADELGCSEKCLEYQGNEGLIWDDIEKDCFNILYLRCEQALSKFPDQEWLDYEKQGPDRRRGWTSIVWQWREILDMMKLDKRFDQEWINAYLQRRGEPACKLITPSQAREMAEAFIKENIIIKNDEYVIVDSDIYELEDGWLFPYQSAKYIKTGEHGFSLVGNGPIFVAKTGDLVEVRRD